VSAQRRKGVRQICLKRPGLIVSKAGREHLRHIERQVLVHEAAYGRRRGVRLQHVKQIPPGHGRYGRGVGMETP